MYQRQNLPISSIDKILQLACAIILILACVSDYVHCMPYNNNNNDKSIGLTSPNQDEDSAESVALQQPVNSGNLARDDDDDDDDNDASHKNPDKDQMLFQDSMAAVASTNEDPMTVSASHHHHHKKYVKGMLDMGAWTKKKGAFGWYADFPVGGKGKK